MGFCPIINLLVGAMYAFDARLLDMVFNGINDYVPEPL
jgi:hypothetical protein